MGTRCTSAQHTARTAFRWRHHQRCLYQPDMGCHDFLGAPARGPGPSSPGPCHNRSRDNSSHTAPPLPHTRALRSTYMVCARTVLVWLTAHLYLPHKQWWDARGGWEGGGPALRSHRGRGRAALRATSIAPRTASVHRARLTRGPTHGREAGAAHGKPASPNMRTAASPKVGGLLLVRQKQRLHAIVTTKINGAVRHNS